MSSSCQSSPFLSVHLFHVFILSVVSLPFCQSVSCLPPVNRLPSFPPSFSCLPPHNRLPSFPVHPFHVFLLSVSLPSFLTILFLPPEVSSLSLSYLSTLYLFNQSSLSLSSYVSAHTLLVFLPVHPPLAPSHGGRTWHLLPVLFLSRPPIGIAWQCTVSPTHYCTHFHAAVLSFTPQKQNAHASFAWLVAIMFKCSV
jgi:hypothetical protein